LLINKKPDKNYNQTPMLQTDLGFY